MAHENLGVAVRDDLGYTRGMKTAISMPNSTCHDADALAKRLGISRSELYARAVAELVARHNGALVPARLDAIHAQHDARTDSSLAGLQARAIPREALW